MKICPICKKANIDEKYSMCISCLNKTKENNQQDELIKVITMCNWNFGATQKWQKLALLNDLENQTNLTDIQKKIMDLLLKDLEKDILIIEDIKKEKNQKV